MNAMGFVPVENVMKCELVFGQDSTVFENTLYFKKDAAIVGADFIPMGEFLRDWWDDNLSGLISTSTFLAKILMADLTVQNGIGFEFSDTLPINGGEPTDALPLNCAITVKLSTGFRGRGYRGRNYIGGLVDASAIKSMINTSVGVQIIAAYDLLITQTAMPAFTLCVVSRVLNGVERAAGVATPVISASMDQVMDSQRRRLPGRGR